jgi:O-antigen/teichoic acid export membrane protein
LQAIKWNYLGTIARVLSQFVAQIALARLLGPEVVGSFGYVLLLSGLLGLMIDQGLGWAVVHATLVNEREFKIVFARVMIAASACALGSFLLADQIATWMGAIGAAQTIRYFSPSLVLLGLTVITQAKLRKALLFKEIQISQTLSYLIAYPIVGVTLAAYGLGVISLIVAWALQAALAFFMMQRYAPQSFAFANPLAKLTFDAYGRDILAINLVNWLVDNAGAVFIGRLFGNVSLGLYNTTLSLVRTPANHLVVNLQTVLFPAAAAVKSNVHSLARMYGTALAVVLFVGIPGFSFVAIASPAIVITLLGPKWTVATDLLPPIALAMIPHMLSSITGSTLSGRGDQKIELMSQLAVMLMLIASYFVLDLGSTQQVCWVFLALYSMRALFLTCVAANRFQISYACLLGTAKGPTIVACLSGLLYRFIEYQNQLTSGGLIFTGCLIFALVSAVALALKPKFFLDTHIIQLIAPYKNTNGITSTIVRWLSR